MNNGIKAGTAGGTLLILIVRIPLQDIATTAILAAIGATVSFLVSLCLKVFLKWIKPRL